MRRHTEPLTHRVFGLITLLVTMTLLAGCGMLLPRASPTSTATNAAGETVVVDWADYPAHAGHDGAAILDAPDQSELEGPARDLVERVRLAVERESRIALVAEVPEDTWFDQDQWFPQTGNGYGGESLLITVNCCELLSSDVPDPSRWRTIIDAASEATVEAGAGPLIIEHEQVDRDAAQQREYRDRYCNTPTGECWLLSATAFDGYQWVYVTIQDGSLDPSGEAAREADEFGWPLASIAISYGATVVRAGESDAYARAMEPFLGLERPAETTSD